MFDLDSPPITLGQVARRFGSLRKDRPVSPVTVARWINKGLFVNGQRVRLAAMRIGRTWATNEPALQAFLAAINGTTNNNPAPRSPAERNRASAAAARKLDQLGIGC